MLCPNVFHSWREAAIELIQQPVYGLLKYEPQAIEYLLKLSGGRPYLLQYLCYLIIKRCSAKDKLLVDLETIEAVVPFLYEDIYFLHYAMDRLAEVEQRVILAAAPLIQTDRDTFTINQLGKVLSEGNAKLSMSQLKNSLDNLVRRELLTVDDQGNYKFTMEIFQRWLVERAK